MIKYFALLALLAFYSGYAQHSLPDSVYAKYGHLRQDSSYVNILNKAATTYLKTNPNVSRKVSEHSLEVASRIKYTRGYARALTIMGNSYWYEGMYEFAQNYYLLAARQYHSIKDSIGLGQTYNNIGEVYKKLNDLDNALEYLLKAIDLKKKDPATRAITYYNVGELYIRLNNISEAQRYIDRSFAIATAENNERVIAFDYWSFAAIETHQNKPEEALKYYFKAETIWKQLGETRSLIQTYQDIAEVFRRIKKFPEAEYYLTQAMQLAKTIKVPDLQVKNYERFARLDSTRGNFSKALFYMSKHNALKDSVYNLLKAEQIARLQTIYETESREQENQQLRTTQALKDAQLEVQYITLIAISVGLILAGIVASVLYRQRKKISFQKEAIEVQATALLKLNEELQLLNRNLEARIEQRTSQLSVQNQRLAEFTFINAHKLRAPVASILGLINLLYQGAEDEKETILAHLRTCSEELDHTIRDVSKNLEDAIVKETKHLS
jgi:tetratricopeptide (TPR) repeat protein